MKMKELTLFLVLCLLGSTYAHDLPTHFNLASGRRIEATSTCGVGVSEKELFCKLTGANRDRIDDSYSQVIQGQLCDYCDPTDPSRTHSPEFAIDGSEKWWQSPPLSRGSQYNEVNLTIHLDQEFHVAYIYMRMGNSPRPGVFILERSKDFGKTYKPWQYFADSKSDCNTFFGHLGYDEAVERDDSVICTSEYAHVVPLEGGEVIVSLVNNRPSSNNFTYSETLQEWTKATDVRFRFLRTKTLYARLMATSQSDVTVTRRYYYSIKDISIGGHCVCNGHALSCEKQDVRQPNKLICQCQHNTCGEHCERCCPGFVQKLWQPATLHSSNECEPCQCHGHTSECTYDDEVARNRSSLDIHGDYYGGGICHNCEHNTKGINCERCREGYFKSRGVPMDSPYACERCRCDSRYSTGDCDDETGRCKCKPEFAAPDCKSCSVGYYGYPHCKPCRCHVNGTEGQICDSGAGSCPCKYNYAGPNCNHCAPDYFNFPSCSRCNCDPMGSQGSRCDPTTGQCICNPRFGGLNCGQCANGFFGYPSCQYCSCDSTGSTEKVCDKDNGQCLCKGNFAGERCNQCLDGFHRFPFCVACGCNELGVMANLCQENGQCYCKPNFVGKICDQCAPGYYRYPDCLPCNCVADGSHGLSCDQETGQCHCRDHFLGVMCDECRPNYYNFPLCEECSCDPAGAMEIPGYPLGGCGLQSGGRLCHCKERVRGRLCDVCEPSYWNLSIRNPQGCEDCHCDTRGTLGGGKGCDAFTGQCVCKPFVDGKRCNKCTPGTFNIQEHNAFGCQPCNCDMGGSLDGSCDENGQCRCKPRVQGKKCDSPISTHYYPNLHHLKFELEEGKTRNGGPVRYGFDRSDFPDYSWKGYAVFSKLQNEVLYEAEIKKPGLYKLLYRYKNNQNIQVTAGVSATPHYSIPDASPQPSNTVFLPTNQPDFSFASSGAGVISTFFLNSGPWTFALETPEQVYVDYMVLLPSAYYEATLLHNKFYMPCTIPASNDVCKHYVYVDLGLHRGSKGSEGRTRTASGFQDTQVLDDQDTLDKLNIDAMAKLDDRQTSLTLDVPVGRPGQYAFLVSYHTKDSKRTQEVEVHVVGSDEDAVLRMPNCPYTSPCRQYIHDPHHNIKFFQVDSDHATLTLTGRSDIDVAIDHVYAVPVNQATPSLIEPKFQCIYRNEKCATGLPTISVPGTRIDFKVDGEGTDKPPFTTTDPHVKVVQLHRSSPQVEIRVSVTKADDYILVPLYYQPYIAGFAVDVVVYHDGQVHKGKLHADYCPSMSGCHARVTFKNQTKLHLSDPNVRITFNSTRPVWLDYIVIVPSSSYSDKIMGDNTGADESNEFIDHCASDDYDIDDSKSGFCKENVYTLVTDYNNGALPCDCSADGSENFNCQQYAGQCRCKANIIGRTCSQCQTGYWGFPNCQACNCPHGMCDASNGQCVCAPKVTGANCDTCLPQTFGFDAVIGCEDCACNAQGVDGNTDCDTLTGECRCKANVGGRRCERCDIGHYSFPQCSACSCDASGVVEDVCDQVTSQCLCKANVEGSFCDKCKDSTFFLEARNPLGCSKCFCFGVTSSCHSSQMGWNLITSMNDWKLTNVLEAPVNQNDYTLTVDYHQLIQSKNPVYWVAPAPYTGNKVASYGGELKYTVYSEKQDDSEVLIKPDVILAGGDMRISYRSDLLVNAGEEYNARVDLIESKFVHEATGSHVSREQLMTVLANLEDLLIRGTFYSPTTIFRLSHVELQAAAPSGYGDKAISVEVCRCPPNYSGTSCETCAAGYHRAQGDNLGVCEPCLCNNRADSCHPLTGVCQDCKDNFDGPQCYTCKQGYYHDNNYDICKPCSCPSREHNFASTCDVSPSGTLDRCYCLPGYTGRNCQRCAPSYWGQPLQPGGRCEQCQCNGNINTRDPGACDEDTGLCLRCLGNTAGDSCERCVEGFYGDAVVQKNCRRCGCDPVGTEHCDHETGRCMCKSNVHGPTCSQCVSGAYGFQSARGCEMCECGAASLTNMCDTRSGQCECRTGVDGRKCDECMSGYFNYGARGCEPCQCLSKGAVTCNAVTGECVCLPGVTGPNCDRCQPKWVMIEGSGCRECDSCIHLLIDDIEILDRNVTSMREELENVTMGVQAFKKLESVNISIIELQPKVDEIINSEAKANNLEQLKNDLVQVQDLTDKVLVRSEHVTRQCETVSTDAVDIKKKANSLYDEILEKALHDVTEAVSFVKAILATITGSASGGHSIEPILRDAEEMLVRIKAFTLDQEHQEASTEVNRAAETLERAKELLGSARHQVNSTQEISVEIEEILSKLLDLQNHTKMSMEKATKVHDINTFITNTKNHVAKMIDLIRSRRTEFEKCMQDTVDLVSKSAEHVEHAKQSLSGIENEMMDLEKALKDVDEFSNDLNQENAGLKDLVDKALDHTSQLERQSMEVQNLLTNTKSSAEAALRASEAYEKIVKAIEDAMKAYEDALSSAKTAHDLSEGLSDKVNASKINSDKLRTESLEIYRKLEKDLKNKLVKITSMLHDIKQVVVKENVTEVLTGVADIRTKGLGDQAQNASKIANEYLKVAQESDEMIKKYAKITQEDSENLRNLPEKIQEVNLNINQAERSLKEVSDLVPQGNDLIADLLSQADVLSQLQSTLRGNMDSLRNQIQVARDTANLINVGVNFTEESYLQVRNVKQMNSAGLSTATSLSFKTPSLNGLLYYIGNNKDEYMSLEMLDGYLVYKVNTGEGESVLKSSSQYADDKWHDVEVARAGAQMRMVVREDGEVVGEESVVMQGNRHIMNFDFDTNFYVGGVPDFYKAEVGNTLAHPYYHGCIDDLTFEDNRIGPWNFVHAHNIRGSKKKQDSNKKQPKEVKFGGNGYLIMDKERADISSKSTVAFSFKTFEKDGLMFYAGQGTNYMALELKNGKMLLRYDLGSGPGSIESKNTFNNGEWVHLLAKRRDKISLVKLNDETLEERPRSLGAQTTLDVGHELFLGGYKGTHNASGVTNKAFKGCMKDFTLNTNSRNLMENIEAKDITPGCIESSKMVSFLPGSDGSYVVLQNLFQGGSEDLDISFKFRTNQTHALIFYAHDDNQESSLSLSIVDKYLKLMLVTNDEHADVTSASQVDDSKWHYLQLKGRDNKFKFLLDGSEELELETQHNLQLPSSSPFYIGNFPLDYSVVNDNVGSVDQYLGCLGDLSINSKLIDFSQIPASQKISVTLSSCFFYEPIAPQPPPFNAHPDPDHPHPDPDHPHPPQPPFSDRCYLPLEVDSQDSYQFGLSHESRMEQHSVQFKNSESSEYHFEFKIKPDSHDGLIYYISSHDHVDFVGIYMNAGFIKVAFNCGGGIARMSTLKRYNDGRWHSLDFTRIRKEAHLMLDRGEEEVVVEAPGNPKSIEVKSPHFIGGLSSEAMRDSGNNLEGVVYPFRGCLRSMSSDGVAFETDNMKEVMQGCAGPQESGIFFFDVDSVAVVEKNFNVPVNLDISLEIKPRLTTATLLSVFNPSTFEYLLLQMIQGDVHFTMKNQETQVTTSFRPPSKNLLCDGNWHTIKAQKIKNLLILNVDGIQAAPKYGKEGTFAINTNSPLYLGGVIEEHRGLETTKSYVGCIRDVKINNDQKHPQHMQTIRGKVEASCPLE